MAETLFEELKRYVGFGPEDERALRELHGVLSPHFTGIADIFYRRILNHEGARAALEGGESRVGRLKVTLVAWMDKLLTGPYDEHYYELRARIGRVHVRISLPQHYMFGAMNVLRREMNALIDRQYRDRPELATVRAALAKILDLELAIMLHTYREDLLAQHARVERLSTFGQLVGSIGHELRNPLGVMETSLFILRGRVGEDERVTKHVDRIGEQIKLANDIVNQLLDMIRDRPLDRQRIRMSDVLQAAMSSLRRPPELELSIEGVAELPWVEGDPGQLRQVLVNLLENAIHAAGEKGTIRVVGKLAPAAHAKQGTVELAVEDSGPGVDESIRNRLFEPLVTTKHNGIGLGLALVKRIVERHAGSITYQPAAGGGARFVVRLPAGSESAGV